MLFENHPLIAQGGQLEPGQWTGAHCRQGKQILILLNGGALVRGIDVVAHSQFAIFLIHSLALSV